MSGPPYQDRVFLVVICRACLWQYGSWWPVSTVETYWGDCPRCGGKTTLGTAFLPARGAFAVVGTQQELAL